MFLKQATVMYRALAVILFPASRIQCLNLLKSPRLTGADPGFPEGGSESGVDIGGGANSSIASLKQGVHPPETTGYLILLSTEIPYY